MSRTGKTTTLLGVLLLAACDLGEYPRLGELRDETQVLGPDATTWVAFEQARVTLLVLSPNDGAAPTGFALTWLGGADGDESLTGTCAVDAPKQTLTLSATVHYKSDTGTSGSGNVRTTVQQTLVFTFHRDDGQLRLSGAMPMPMLRKFQRVAAQLDTTTKDGARCAVELLHLTTGSAELRMPGFGGLGTVEYARPAVFRGQVAGSVRISLDDLLSPRTQFVYDAFSDFDGYTTSGIKTTKTNVDGDGTLDGTLHFEIAHATGSQAGDAGNAISGDVEYGDGSGPLRLRNGSEAGGAYTVSFDGGGSFAVAYDAPTTAHLVQCFTP